MPARTKPGRLLSHSNCPPVRLSRGGLWPAFTYTNFPVLISSTPIQAVTKRPASFPSHSCSLVWVNTLPGVSRFWAWFLMRVLAITMNSAAGTPLPDTSAMTTARWSSSTRKKS